MSYAVCCPTYKKKEPLCLNLLSKDSELTLYLFVREDDYQNGYYDHLKNIERLLIVPIQRKVSCIGETRQYILDWCEFYKIDYCIMLDDGVYSINDESHECSITDAIETSISLLEQDELCDKIACFTFSKREALSSDGTITLPKKQNVGEKYFLCFPLQCMILNINLLLEHNISYHSLEEVGFEDGALFVDMLKAGLICAGRDYLSIDAVVPNQRKLGGNHSANEDLELKYDRQTRKLLKYAGNIMGASIQKRYRAHIGGYLTLLIWDYDYYREVLCEQRVKNSVIIDNNLLFENAQK